jgi:uncharacterized protein (DUF1778 family)
LKCPAVVRTEDLNIGAAFLDIETMVGELRSETRSERPEQRIKPTIKQTIEWAAMLTGTETSEFVTMAAFQAAIERIREMCRIQLTAEQAARFFAAIEEPRAPTQELRDLRARRAFLVEED